MHLAKVGWEQSLFSIKFSFEWVYFRGEKPHECSSIYTEKIVKNHLWRYMTILRWRWCVATKIDITFFCKKWGVEYFSCKNFFEKKQNNFFQNNWENFFFGGDDQFLWNGALDDKNKYNLFYGKLGTEYGFEVFSSKKPILAKWKPKNQFWGHIFSYISGSIWLMFSKTLGLTHVWTLTNHMNFMKIGSKLRLVTVIIIISWEPRTIFFECKLKNIYKVLLLESILIRMEILWRINFILIKFLVNKLLLEKLWNECKKPSKAIPI